MHSFPYLVESSPIVWIQYGWRSYIILHPWRILDLLILLLRGSFINYLLFVILKLFRTKQSIYVIWLWLSSLHSYTSSTSQIIRTKERKLHHVRWWSWANDYLSFTSSIRWRLLVIGRRMLCKSFEVQKPQGEFSSMKEIFKENWGKKIKIKTKQNEHAVRSRLVIGGLV